MAIADLPRKKRIMMCFSLISVPVPTLCNHEKVLNFVIIVGIQCVLLYFLPYFLVLALRNELHKTRFRFEYLLLDLKVLFDMIRGFEFAILTNHDAIEEFTVAIEF